MPTTFHVPKNNVSTTVTAGRSGGAPVVVADGAAFGTVFPLIVSFSRPDTPVSGQPQTYTELCILPVTARTGNTLTVGAAIEATTDVPFLTGDIAEMRPTALALSEVQAVVNAGETAIATLNTSVAGLTTTTTGLSTTVAGQTTAIAGLTSSLGGKQASGNYITALTGDVTASGPGSVAATLATVNSNVGNFTNANISVDAKGRIIAAANGTGGGGGSGTVTSVALTVPTGLAVSGTPITGTGTLAITTALSGIVKGNGSGLVVATAGTDYLLPNGSGAALTGITESQVGTLPADLTAITDRLTNLETVTETAITGAITLDATAFGKVFTLGGSADYTVTLPTAVGNDKKTIAFRVLPTFAHLVTIDGNASETIDLALAQVVFAKESMVIESDNANYSIINGRRIAMFCRMQPSSATSIPNITFVDIPLNTVPTSGDNTGLMADTTGHQVTIRRTGWYEIHASLQMLAIPPGVDVQVQIRVNGAYAAYDSKSYTSAYFKPYKFTNLLLTAGDVVAIQAYQDSGASASLANMTTECFLYVHEIL